MTPVIECPPPVVVAKKLAVDLIALKGSRTVQGRSRSKSWIADPGPF